MHAVPYDSRVSVGSFPNCSRFDLPSAWCAYVGVRIGFIAAQHQCKNNGRCIVKNAYE